MAPAPTEEVLATARRHAAEQGVEVTFESGDVYALGYDDASFDVVHAHQVLQHLSNPVAALKEMRRVTRPGGIVAVRDGDYSCFSWAPLDPRLDRWQELYRAVARKNGGEPDAGRFLKRWALEAGFSDMRVSSSTWTFADSESCRWWGALWADRCELSDLGDQIVKHGLADRSELSAIVARLLGAVSVGAQRDPCRAVLILDALSVLGIVDRGLADGGERRRFSAGKF